MASNDQELVVANKRSTDFDSSQQFVKTSNLNLNMLSKNSEQKSHIINVGQLKHKTQVATMQRPSFANPTTLQMPPSQQISTVERGKSVTEKIAPPSKQYFSVPQKLSVVTKTNSQVQNTVPQMHTEIAKVDYSSRNLEVETINKSPSPVKTKTARKDD